MVQNTRRSGFFAKLIRGIGGVWPAFRYRLRSGRLAIRNRLRTLRKLKLDYIVIPIGGSFPERSGPRRSFFQRQLPLPPDPLSLETLNDQLRRIADAPNVKGVLFIFRGFSAGTAKLQNLRGAIQRLKDSGKECVVYTPYLDTAHYYVASTANRLIVPPSATFEMIGLHSEAIFLKDALTKIGIQAEVVQISPFKGAYDAFDKSDITPEQKEQLNWLLDESYDILTASIAADRGMNQQRVIELIDQAPMSAESARSEGLVDDLAYEDMLPYILAENPDKQHESSNNEETSNPIESGKSRKRRPKAKLANWSQAQNILIEKSRRPIKNYIGVVSLEGAIVMGPSRRAPVKLPIPLVGSNTSGEETIVRMLRKAERDGKMAALIFHVDSGGGSPVASDLIWREISRIASKKPVIAYFGNVAASGGYYVAAAANHIMAQPLTITGSIGVITLHINTSGFFNLLGVNRRSFNRGERATLYSDNEPLSDIDREILNKLIHNTYEQFKEVVSVGRELPLEDLDPICEGRVWTGRQAMERKLIDSHGDFVDVVNKAATLAELPLDDQYLIPVYNIHPRGGRHLLPRAIEPVDELLRRISLEQFRDFTGRPLLMMPFDLRFW